MLSRLVKKFFLLFKLDINKYKETLKQNEFVFEKERKFYLVIKFLTYFFIFFCSCCFIYMYIILKQDNNFQYPYYYQNKLIYISLSSFSKTDWVYILFGIIYLISLYKITKNFMKINNESDKFYKKNLLYSFDYVYYTSIFLIVIIRMILFFTLDDFQTFLNKNNLEKTYLLNSNNQNIVTEIATGYYLLIIINILLMICIIILFLSKSKLKAQYMDNKE